MKSLLVTGAAGFIGSHLLDRILSNNLATLVAVDNFNDFYDPKIKRSNVAQHWTTNGFHFHEADITSWDDMAAICGHNRFDCIVHLAAYAGVRPSLERPLLYERTNVRGTYLLLELARHFGIPKFIFASSSSVYGRNSRVPFSESDRTDHIVSPYAATKLAGEVASRLYSHLYGMRVVCLRFFTVYGARQRPDLAIHKFSRSIWHGIPIQLFGDGTSSRDYTYIDDIIDGILAAVDYDDSPFEVINLGGSQPVELIRLVQLLEAGLSRKAVIEWMPEQPGDVPITYADISKATRLLGYRPITTFESGLDAFVSWFRDYALTNNREKIQNPSSRVSSHGPPA
jgi:UDP-glucuronate 4-epimerase